MLPETAWKATLGELELQMTKATFNTWLKDARFVAYDEDEYVIGVHNDYAKDWLENRLEGTVIRTLSAVTGQPASVRFVVGDKGPAKLPDAANGEVRERQSRNGNGGSKRNRNMNGSGRQYASGRETLKDRNVFSNFVVGHSNRLAHAAAISVAEKPGQAYNPLFIYGGVGLGKTHLLHAIGHQCLDSGYSVCYITSESFTNDLIQAIRAQTMADFREKYRSPDVLLIDDIQFIAGKESTQEEIFHTFNHLHSGGKQVILSSDRPPKAMVTLEERLQSRFEWGLMADIQLPDAEMRSAILHAKAEESGVYIPVGVIELIAQYFRNNIRELEGALNKVIAYSDLMGKPINMELVNVALADLMRAPVQVSVQQVIDQVIAYYRLSMERLMSSNRSRSVSFPRQVAMYLARTETDASFPQIGIQLGNRDHTTILHGFEKIANLIETDEKVRRDVLQIKAALYQSSIA